MTPSQDSHAAVSDPRVRMLGGLTTDTPHTGDDPARALLNALDGVRVHVVLGHNLHDTDRTAGLVLVGLCARLFGEVHLHGPDRPVASWWGEQTAASIRASARALRPSLPSPAVATSVEFTITFGESEAQPLPNGELLGVGGGDWVAALAATSLPCRSDTHGFGTHAAVCLAVAQLLARTLARHGLGPAPAPLPASGYALNLLTHRPLPDPTPSAWPTPSGHLAVREPLPVALAGVGSVGSSVAGLLAGASAPVLTRDTIMGQTRPPAIEFVCLDADTFDPTRNPFRYLALRGDESGPKAHEIAARLRGLGLPARGLSGDVAAWVTGRDRPGFEGVLVSSVDTIDGRLAVADALARETLSVGVSGLALHVQREHLGDGHACPFCDYVDAAPATTQAQMHAEVTGLSVERVLTLLNQSMTLDAADVAAAVSAGKIATNDTTRFVGARLADLVRGAYAEAAVLPAPIPGAAAAASTIETPNPETPAVAAPHVSWFAGVLAAAEVLKELHGLPRLDRRVDVDLAGLPPGVIRRRSHDETGRCVCHSTVRRRWMQRLYPSPGRAA